MWVHVGDNGQKLKIIEALHSDQTGNTGNYRQFHLVKSMAYGENRFLAVKSINFVQ